MANNTDTLPHPILSTILIIVAALCLVLANAALWFNHYIFNTQNFSAVATPVLSDSVSREAMSAQITEELLTNHPGLKNLVNDPLEKMIAGLLNSDAAKTITGKVVLKLHTYITSPNPQPVVIDFTSVKDKIGGLLDIAGQLNSQATSTENLSQSISNVPDQVILLEPSDLPNIYETGSRLQWIGPFALVLGLLFLFIPIYLARYSKRILAGVLVGEAIALVAAGCLSLMAGSAVKPELLSKVDNPNIRVIFENLFNHFAATFNTQTAWLFGLAIVFAIVSLWFYLTKPKVIY